MIALLLTAKIVKFIMNKKIIIFKKHNKYVLNYCKKIKKKS